MPSTRFEKSDGIDGFGCQLHERKLLQSGLRDVVALATFQSKIFRNGTNNGPVGVLRASYKFLG